MKEENAEKTSWTLTHFVPPSASRDDVELAKPDDYYKNAKMLKARRIKLRLVKNVLYVVTQNGRRKIERMKPLCKLLFSSGGDGDGVEVQSYPDVPTIFCVGGRDDGKVVLRMSKEIDGRFLAVLVPPQKNMTLEC